MIPEFDRLAPDEVEMMLKAPVLACILIAGADDDIDSKEISRSIEMAKRKLKKFESSNLGIVYENVAEDFEDKLKILLQNYPHDPTKRTELISNELSQLNQILPKLPLQFAGDYYNSVKDMALKIAESSGGLLGIKTVGSEEARLVDLPMINNPSKH